MGRSGSGPGEFEIPTRLGLKDDSLYVLDPRQQRVSVFELSGRHVRTTRLPAATLPNASNQSVSPIALTPDGGFIGEASASLARIAQGHITSRPIVLVDPSGAVRSTLISDRDVTGTAQLTIAGDRIILGVLPLAEKNFFAIAPDGSSLVFVDMYPSSTDPDRFRVLRVSTAGDTIVDRFYRYTPRLFPTEIGDSIRSTFPGESAGTSRCRATSLQCRMWLPRRRVRCGYVEVCPRTNR